MARCSHSESHRRHVYRRCDATEIRPRALRGVCLHQFRLFAVTSSTMNIRLALDSQWWFRPISTTKMNRLVRRSMHARPPYCKYAMGLRRTVAHRRPNEWSDFPKSTCPIYPRSMWWCAANSLRPIHSDIRCRSSDFWSEQKMRKINWIFHKHENGWLKSGPHLFIGKLKWNLIFPLRLQYKFREQIDFPYKWSKICCENDMKLWQWRSIWYIVFDARTYCRWHCEHPNWPFVGRVVD